MPLESLQVVRRPESFRCDDHRVIPRYLNFRHPPRIRAILRRLLKVREAEVSSLLASVRGEFNGRHRDLDTVFETNYRTAIAHLPGPPEVSEQRRRLIGACFTMEYAIESAALFNPSIVPHPDQSGLPAGDVRFLMSLRATGEGHVSSIVFRRGVLHASGQMSFDPPPRFAHAARVVPDRAFDKAGFCRLLRGMEVCDGLAGDVLDALDDPFTLGQIEAAIERLRPARPTRGQRTTAADMRWVARASYELDFPRDCLPAEIVIFPATPYEQHGMEDLRLVRFVGGEGRERYCGTYTAYDGRQTHSMLLQTDDFHRFHVSPLAGRCARHKGMALFPRLVDGQYLMLTRHDGENLFLARSANLHTWDSALRLQKPAELWETVQIGNCGSPLETDAGWIVLTHGVGPMRRYCIGALLLDRRDPARVIGRLREPLLVPNEHERAGYVPNVVYSCGSMIHGGQLIIPYAMSDSRTSFASVEVSTLIDRLVDSGP